MRLDRIFGEDRRWTREAGAAPQLISDIAESFAAFAESIGKQIGDAE